MNKRKHDWKHFSRRTLSLILVLVTLVALCIPTGMALEDNSADVETQPAAVQTAETETGADTGAAATSETDAQPVAETEPTVEVKQEPVTEPEAEQVSEPETTAPTPAETQTAQPTGSEQVSEPETTEPEQTTVPTVAASNVQTVSEPVGMIDLDGDAEEAAFGGNDQIATYATDVTVAPGSTKNLSGSQHNCWKHNESWTSADPSVATVSVSTSGGWQTVTLTGVKTGTTTITHTYCNSNGYGYWTSHEEKEIFNVTVQGAAIYYLKAPDKDANSNDTGEWLPDANTSDLLATVNVAGVAWTGDKNLFFSSDEPETIRAHVLSWPDGSTGTSWVLLRDSQNEKNKATFQIVLDAVFENYRQTLQSQLGITDLSKSDIDTITLIPAKISKNNGGTYETHLDCNLSITSSKAFLAKFWVTQPNGSKADQVDEKWYREDSRVEKTKVNIPLTKTVGGVEYVFDGWYNEAGQKVSEWSYGPNATELEDGVVNFYANYVPAPVNITVTKEVTNTTNSTDTFDFSYRVNGKTRTFTLTAGESTSIQVPFGSTVTVTETEIDDDTHSYDTTWKINSGDSRNGLTATLTNAKNGDNITFINNYQSKVGDLTVTKNINGLEGEELENLKNALTFTVTNVNDASDSFTFTKDDLTMDGNTLTYTKEGLKAGTTYKVEEGNADVTHYDRATSGEGNVTIKAKETATVDIVNNYTKNVGDLTIVKNIQVNSKWMTDDELNKLKQNITFTATNPVTHEEKTFTGTWNENTFTATITDLPVGTTWTVSEANYELDYHNCTAKFTDNKNSATIKADEVQKVEITNTYTDKLIDLTITKTVSGKHSHDASFTFIATNNRTGVSYTLTIVGNGTDVIKQVPAGNYTVKELDNDNYKHVGDYTFTRDVVKDETFSFENKGTGDSYQYSSSAVNKGAVDKDGKIIFTKPEKINHITKTN